MKIKFKDRKLTVIKKDYYEINNKKSLILYLLPLGSICNDKIKNDNKVNIICIPDSENFIMYRTSYVIKTVCDFIDHKMFRNGFSIYAESIGGILARIIIEKCKPSFKLNIISLVTVSSPHGGIWNIPKLDHPLIKHFNVCFYPFAYLMFACSFALDGKNKNSLIYDLNNFDNNNRDYKNNFLKLKVVVLAWNEEDKVIEPKSGKFYKKSGNNVVFPYINGDFDDLGLLELEKYNRLFVCKLEGEHLNNLSLSSYLKFIDYKNNKYYDKKGDFKPDEKGMKIIKNMCNDNLISTTKKKEIIEEIENDDDDYMKDKFYDYIDGNESVSEYDDIYDDDLFK